MLRSDRRATDGDALADAFLRAEGSLCFDDLVEATPNADVGDVSAWLGHALQEGLVEEIRAELGAPRCFRLRSRGRRIMTLARRADG
ncbi:MAG TPA: hypothetical protein VGW10_13375 [Solirubrobacteraceae bacterium]|nr:hypothetical protein [Solirubrobacteraceae bacterium]